MIEITLKFTITKAYFGYSLKLVQVPVYRVVSFTLEK